MKDKKRITVLAALYILGIILLMFTKPDGLPLIGLLLPFVYLFVVVYLTVELFARRGFRINPRFSKTIAIISSIFVSLLLVMRSITQLTLRDILLSVGIAGILTWYIVKLGKRT